MKKTMIALAVAAAMPVAAQADVTLSGSIEAEFTLGANNSAPAIDTSFSAASSEVLTNGMTATASFDVLGGDSQGTVGLSGDFGSVTAGTGEATDLTDTEDHDSLTMTGVSYTGEFAGLSVNAASGEYNATSASAVAVPNGGDYTTYGASYDFNGLAVSASNTNDVTTVSATYAFGDLTVKVAKDSDDAEAVGTATYAATMGDLSVTAVATTSNTWDLDATYTMGDISLSLADAEDEEPAISASYASGALTVTVDSDSDVSVAYDMGNADIAIERDSSVATNSTTVSYTVSF